MGRPFKPFYAPWLGKSIDGLCRLRDRRWRIVSTGERFREEDPRKAVDLYYEKTRQCNPRQVFVGQTLGTQVGEGEPQWNEEFGPSINMQRETGVRFSWTTDGEKLQAGVWVPEALLGRWLADQLRTNKHGLAKLAGVPALATIDEDAVPSRPLKLEKICEVYEANAAANWRTKGQARAAINRLMEVTGAAAIQDLTTEKLIAFREKINTQLAPSGAAQIFAKVKAVFSFALKYGLDASQLGPALARLKTLYAPPSSSKAKPQPISRADFNRLLALADIEWSAILLLSLNMALYLEDVCTLCWEEFNLNAGTYSGKRRKTGVVRVGWLWPETIQALRALPMKGLSPLLFTSQTGLRFNASSKYDTYKSLRERAGVAAPFSSIRDAAYSAATAACDEKTAKLFAAHRFTGTMDSYVKRRPDLVREAANAVRMAYGPFVKKTRKGKEDN